VEEGTATQQEREKLALPRENGTVIRIQRVRSIMATPLVVETVTVPARLFPGLAGRPIPNNLYGLYSEDFGVTVARAEERLKVLLIGQDDAAILNCAPGVPALLIDRIAYSLDNAIVEWRVSRCLTQDHHYRSDLR
jgi:GntR family transcriptional regulator